MLAEEAQTDLTHELHDKASFGGTYSTMTRIFVAGFSISSYGLGWQWGWEQCRSEYSHFCVSNGVICLALNAAEGRKDHCLVGHKFYSAGQFIFATKTHHFDTKTLQPYWFWWLCILIFTYIVISTLCMYLWGASRL